MAGNIVSVDVAVLIAVSGNVAAWVKVFMDSKKYRSSPPTNGNGVCTKTMQVERGEKIAQNTTRIDGLKGELHQLREDNREDHNQILAKLDRNFRASKNEN